MLNEFAISIVRTLREHSHQAYLAGGCVRDILLGREPADYDVATDATPDEVLRIFPNAYGVGAQFGVVLAPRDAASNATTENSTVEVATFRSDIGYSDGRHPDEVRFSKDPREDVQRRDFTINGMMLDPISDEVFDFIGGQKDLSAKIIRCIGEPEHRFGEDKLRMLRAVRFAARFGFEIEPTTFSAIRRLAPQIHQVSR